MSSHDVAEFDRGQWENNLVIRDPNVFRSQQPTECDCHIRERDVRSTILSIRDLADSQLFSAAKTALLLDNTQLGPSQVQVSSGASLSELAGSAAGGKEEASHDENNIAQEDKPRSRIVAEYLAHGYTISDRAIQNAIALDNKHGVSTRFTNALTSFDSKYKATDRAKGIDASYGISDKANQGWRGMSSYFEKALNTPTGQRLVTFYTQGDKQVRDIHAEARRLADIKGGKPSAGSPNTFAENEKSMEKVPGSENTTCKCGGDDGTCPCAAGKCACNGCSKSESASTEKPASSTTAAPS